MDYMLRKKLMVRFPGGKSQPALHKVCPPSLVSFFILPGLVNKYHLILVWIAVLGGPGCAHQMRQETA